MSNKFVPINKGNYSMDTPERESLFEKYRGLGWEKAYREYRDNWSNYAKSQSVSEYPLLVDVELSSICNLSCPMCYTITNTFKRRVKTTLMDWELYKKIIHEIAGEVPALRLSLRGEATMHRKFVECIRYAKEQGIGEVSTLTNGARMTPGFFEESVDAGIDWITVSVDGVGETYENIRRPLKFEELLEKVKYMKRCKKERGLVRPVIKVQSIWPAIKEDPGTYYDTFAPYADLVAFNPLIDYLGNDREIEYLENFTCPQQYQRLVIGADGLVMKCSNDEENLEVVGDLNEETVHQVWHGERMVIEREMQKQTQGFLKSKVCRKCYLPRRTYDEEATVGGRTFIVKNYVNRKQVVGK